MFKRKDTVLRIIKVLEKIKPKRIYLISDAGRNKEEIELVNNVRSSIEQSIDWECDIIKNYANKNRGVYSNIGLGARWVLEREESAIFLEDDNLPEITFFEFCNQMLDKYRYDNRVLWICGTNYLSEYRNKNNDSYMFTQHLLPCGWASWSQKFLKVYDGELKTFKNKIYLQRFKDTYTSQALYKQQLESIYGEYRRGTINKKFASWDYQMLFSLRSNNMYGISPAVNQIRNIGADEFSIHGGNSLDKEMTRRFCEVPTKKMEFPLVHPTNFSVDKSYERKIGKIILLPISMRIKLRLNKVIKLLLGIDPYDSLTNEFKKKFIKKDK
ncbi:glycosyltransferase family 2 protein [Clostridium perfringens]|nr:glycosyltransferase family 2 protein [Clostridium perfringens]MDM0605556.1 glycosyltransferase family 2 protein [Clostridium perfringens]